MATLPQFVPVDLLQDLEYPQREAAFFYGLFLRGHSADKLRQDIEVPSAVLAKWHREADQRIEMWKAAAAASGIDYGRDLAGKQMCEKIAPRVAQRLAAKLGTETAEKWVGRLVPLAGSAIGGALNFSFVRGWGRRVQRHLRARHLEARASAARASQAYTAP